MFSSPATCGGRFGVRIVGPMFFLSTFGVDVHRGVHGVVCEVSSFTFKESIREDVKPKHPLFWWRFGEASLNKDTCIILLLWRKMDVDVGVRLSL